MSIAPVGIVTDVQPHPNSASLDIVTIVGKINVANRPAPEQPRYKIGDHAIVLGENLILPEALIKHLDMWNEVKNKGGLAGNKGNRTKARNVGGVLSEVALCRVDIDVFGFTKAVQVIYDGNLYSKVVSETIEGTDMADLLGITEYVPFN